MGDTGRHLPKEEPNLVESGQGPLRAPTFHSSLAMGLSRQCPCPPAPTPWLPEFEPQPHPPAASPEPAPGGAGPQQCFLWRRSVCGEKAALTEHRDCLHRPRHFMSPRFHSHQGPGRGELLLLFLRTRSPRLREAVMSRVGARFEQRPSGT